MTGQMSSRDAWTALPESPGSSSRQYSFLGMPAVFSSLEMQRLLEVASRIARMKAAVLITGETGTGKELIARAVHHYSERSHRPWVDVNCAALPHQLLESELFGYERGAFSGADTSKQGMFELADGGTLFLDEIGELDLMMQVKLLRALDGTPYYRLGGTRKVVVDVRIVTATNVDLSAAVEKGAFRRDLFHRLDQVRLSVPPLRSRSGDIQALAEYFLSAEAPHLRIATETVEVLENYPWPGNVRELKNAIVRAAYMAQGSEVTVQDLPENIRPKACTRPAPRPTLDEMEQQAIMSALCEAGGKQDRAARLLGISRRTLIRKLKTYKSQEILMAIPKLIEG
jgi:transcriptional regulator with PAS, ATPase and Fis domain